MLTGIIPASVVLAWEREIKPDPDKVNVNGGPLL